MKKNILLIAALLFFATNANAHPVTVEWAQKVAAHFWNSYRPTDTKPVATISALPFSDLAHLHVFDINGEGFVIVSGDDRIRPILAYSFENTFPEELNPEVGYWLRGYEAQLAEVAESDAPQSESILQLWGRPILTPAPDEPIATLQNIPAMMKTHWDQGKPYNNLCPFDSVNHARTVVGCVATAMAQIMRYWSYPAYGLGSHTYNYSRFHDISADFENTSYLWHIMPNRCDDFTPESAVKATATISYHCGVAVDMMYGISAEGGSGAYSECGYWASRCATSAFVDVFKYDTTVHHLDRYGHTDEAWTALIDAELAAGRPMYYSGRDSTGGHAFVLDGSDLEGRYHFNWGWNGYGDGFYTVDNLAPGPNNGAGGNATYTFNLDQGAIFGIQPAFQEVFDTINYFDSICENTQYVHFRDYTLLVRNVANRDTLLHHFDTVFNYHLNLISKKRLYLNPNNGQEVVLREYCPATGYTFPHCSFSKTNCMFVGWCRMRDGSDAIYQPGETAYFNNTPTFYALWVDTSANVAIEDPEALHGLTVWPTLTSEHINISFDDAESMTVNIIDNWGRVVIQKESVGRKAQISLERLPAGTYTVQIITKGTLYKSRIIKL